MTIRNIINDIKEIKMNCQQNIKNILMKLKKYLTLMYPMVVVVGVYKWR